MTTLTQHLNNRSIEELFTLKKLLEVNTPFLRTERRELLIEINHAIQCHQQDVVSYLKSFED